MSFAIYSENLVDQATLTASTENASFPVENIQDYRRSKVFRSTSNSDNIVLDFGSASDVNTFFIVPDKRNGFGVATITLEFNSSDSWGAPAATETITFSETHDLGFKEFTATHSYRYCRIVLTSTLGYCEIANIFLGVKNNVVRGIKFGWSYKDAEIVNQKANRYGQIFSDIISRQKQISCSIQYMDKDNLDEFFKAYDLCGESKPFFIRIGCDEMSNDYRRFSGMVFFKDVPSVVNNNFNKYSVSMQLAEAM
jgi:hypothetical protein